MYFDWIKKSVTKSGLQKFAATANQKSRSLFCNGFDMGGENERWIDRLGSWVSQIDTSTTATCAMFDSTDKSGASNDYGRNKGSNKGKTCNNQS
jgi:hypothetical protein